MGTLNSDRGRDASADVSGLPDLAKSSEHILGCQSISNDHINTLLNKMLNNTGETLQVISEGMKDATEKAACIKAAGAIQSGHKQISDYFRKIIAGRFENFRKAIKVESAVAPIPEDEDGYKDLKLVEDIDLEETIAITNLVTKIENLLSRELSALEQRMTFIYPEEVLTPENNPLSPTTICNAFAESVDQLNTGIKVRLVIYKVFEVQLGASIKPWYAEINNYLKSEGVLPKLKAILKKKENVSLCQTDDVAVADPMEQEHAASAATSTPSANESFENIQGLLGKQRRAGPDMPDGEVSYIAQNEMMSTLTGMQQKHALSEGETIGEPVALYDKSVMVEEFKRLTGRSGNQVFDNVSDDVIDIISMMFQYILDDDNLSDAAKALISKLQIPVLKAAIIDKEFFSNMSHPARQLLNELAKVSMGIETSQVETPLYTMVSNIINRILYDFTNNVEIFQELLTELKDFLSKDDDQEEKVESTVLSKHKEREALLLGYRSVTELIEQKLAGKEIPGPVLEIIMGPWRRSMFTTISTEGEDSVNWRAKVKFIDILLWSIIPKVNVRERDKLSRNVKQLLKMLCDGLKQINLEKDEIDRIVGGLEPFHVASLKGETYVPKIVPDVREEVEKVLDGPLSETTRFIAEIQKNMTDIDRLESDFTEDLVDSEEAAEGEDIIVEDIVLSSFVDPGKEIIEIEEDEYILMVKDLKLGDWVEYREGNKKYRAKLSYRSDIMDDYTFLNWRSRYSINRTLRGLAADLRRGSVRIIDNVPVIDRALNALVNGLKNSED
ncbi:MAG: hypothetical protein BMS9Abin26_0786 [Gammaproteobacteria bacterium]|nr:MAG: hypothetical protein BMS9Abin26_0786 [Gammaproteobacteria bacterium]